MVQKLWEKGKGLHLSEEVPHCGKGDRLGTIHRFPYLIWDITAALGSGGFLELPHFIPPCSPPGAGEGSILSTCPSLRAGHTQPPTHGMAINPHWNQVSSHKDKPGNETQALGMWLPWEEEV